MNPSISCELQNATTKVTTQIRCRLVVCRLDELQAHPSYIRHKLSVLASQLSDLIAHGELAFLEPIAITKDHKIIDGYARVELARRQSRVTILCIEHDLTEEEALRWLIQSHRPSRGLNAYSRILIALDLEPSFQEKARANQRSGGQNKSSSNLTEAKRLDVRLEIARIAGVSTGSVTKVRQLRKTAQREVEQAARTGEISIHKAWQWRQESQEKQLEHLRLRRLEQGIKKTVKALVARHQVEILPSTPDPPTFTLPDLVSIVSRLPEVSPDDSSLFGKVAIATLEVPGKGIYVTQELVEAFKPRQKGLLKC